MKAATLDEYRATLGPAREKSRPGGVDPLAGWSRETEPPCPFCGEAPYAGVYPMANPLVFVGCIRDACYERGASFNEARGCPDAIEAWREFARERRTEVT